MKVKSIIEYLGTVGTLGLYLGTVLTFISGRYCITPAQEFTAEYVDLITRISTTILH